MTTFAVQQKVKEIGIRKVLGASTVSIILLFTRDFLRLVFIAFAIGAPLSLYFTKRWLEDFATRINIDGWTFLLAFLTILAVTMITIGLRSLSAASNNPVESLRNE